ncbi:Di-haem cytochrome c peroxidase [Sulfidibacter corallicola]|uniref:Cytochrome c domain-containing protein n=1 Tax=Sulfidibacter corallicola TaxID=2818388 RepID=A0A8A4TJP1_SULCO|nr:cytochrome c peroxidase [Sulfidibacter corallicola]QTD49028.1 hypothetical protein J3U87_25870 [Sulfidibacter corallicola]
MSLFSRIATTILTIPTSISFVTCISTPSNQVFAQEPEIRSIRNTAVATPFRGDGHASTWDGRLIVVSAPGLYAGEPYLGWVTAALRPEALVRDEDGLPDFTAPDAVSEPTFLHRVPIPAGDDGVFSDEELRQIHQHPDAQAVGMAVVNMIALVPHPDRAENPYPVDEHGNPDPGGTFACYDMLVFATLHGFDPFNPEGKDVLGRLSAKIVVGEPKTVRTFIQKAEITAPFAALKTLDDQSIRGIEPTITNDGRLLVFQGDPGNTGEIDVIVYCWNETPGALTGWSRPQSLNRMYELDRDRMVGGIAFHERFPIAKQPLIGADGRPFADEQLYLGAYPWISRDGSELFHTTLRTGRGEQARRAGLAVIGRLTDFRLRPIDGPLNPNRGTLLPDQESEGRLFFSSPGLSPGMWKPFPEARDNPVGNTDWGPVYPLFSSNNANYSEVSFYDPDYVAVVPMNEVVAQYGEVDPLFANNLARTGEPGRLDSAWFPQEYGFDGEDINRGMVGQALYLGDRGSVTVSANELVNDIQSVTVQAFVRRLVDMNQSADNHDRHLVTIEGALELVLLEDGRLQAWIHRNGSRYGVGPAGTPLPPGTWFHGAFTYDHRSGTLLLYQDGILITEAVIPDPGPVVVAGGDLVLGPGSYGQPADFVAGNEAILMMDEVMVSRVVRSHRELARDALRPLPKSQYQTTEQALPLGLERADAKIPMDNAWTAEAAALGERLFFETGLSSNGMSCATCHESDLAFTDGLPLAVGNANTTLKRNTPTILNRLFSAAQFWDGRAASLEEQALLPITNPDEMASSVAEAVAFLSGDPSYVADFQAAFGETPSASTIGKAIASFERTVLGGNSRIDRYEAGLEGLTEGELNGRRLFFGKARCVACHTGSNFTDERFHNTASAADVGDVDAASQGRGAVTGRSQDMGAFKTPTLRDLDLTAPYLHDGSAERLVDVVRLYNRGGRTERGRDFEMRPLGLRETEIDDLVAFLLALRSDATTVDMGHWWPRWPERSVLDLLRQLP